MPAVPKPVKLKKEKKRHIKRQSGRGRIQSDIDSYDSDICLLSNDYVCIMCGGTADQTHHFFPKGSHGNVRFNPLNHCPMDFGCHRRRIHDAGEVEELRDKLIAKIGISNFESLKQEAYRVVPLSVPQLREELLLKQQMIAYLGDLYSERIGQMSNAAYARYIKAKKIISKL
jgi:hypothetical protein